MIILTSRGDSVKLLWDCCSIITSILYQYLYFVIDSFTFAQKKWILSRFSVCLSKKKYGIQNQSGGINLKAVDLGTFWEWLAYFYFTNKSLCQHLSDFLWIIVFYQVLKLVPSQVSIFWFILDGIIMEN